MTLDLSGAVRVVVKYVAEHPGTSHSRIIEQAQDHAGQQRRREAIRLAVAQGSIVRSERRPWQYTVKKEIEVCS
jgi:hypothetical protein